MSADRSDPVTPEAARARDALRSLAPPRAEAAFRERLKRDFVTGRLGVPRTLQWPVAWHRRAAWRLALAPAAAALLVVTGWLAARGPGWTVMATGGDGVVVVDGTPVALANRQDLARRMRAGARVALPHGAEIELASAAGVVVQVTAGTAITLPGTPGRWLNRQVAGAVHHGEIRVTTGSAFRGARLRLATPEALVEVTGTTLAVICEPVGTCVCVYDGLVKVGARGGSMEAIPNGRRRFVFNDDRPPESAGIRPAESTALGKFRHDRRDWLEGAR